MGANTETLRTELERLFSINDISGICTEYLGIDPKDLGLFDPTKAVYVRRLISWCEQQHATLALLDAMVIQKSDQVNPEVAKSSVSGFLSKDLKAGVEIEGYVVREKVGDDGFADTYRLEPAESTPSNGVGYVLKVIHPEHALDPYATERFKTQMRCLQQDFGPGVERVKSVGNLDDGRIFVLSEWEDAVPMAEFLPLGIPEALDVLESVVDALEPLHQKGIAHSNLVSHNIVLGASTDSNQGKQHVKLLGLGVDKLLSSPSPLSGPYYGRFFGVAPEQIKSGEASPQSDIYALGSLLFEWVTGETLFAAETPIETVAAHLFESVPSLGRRLDDPTAEPLDEIIEKTMSKDPAARLNNLDELRFHVAEARRSATKIKARTSIPGTMNQIGPASQRFFGDPESEEGFDNLKEETRKHNAWGAFVEVIEEALGFIENEETRRRLLKEGISASIQKTLNYDKAQEWISLLNEKHPDDPAVPLLERDLLRMQGDYAGLVSHLAEAAEAEEGDVERNDLIRQIASVHYEDLNDTHTAFDYYLEVLSATQVELELLETLEKIAKKDKRFEALATRYGELAHEAEVNSDAEPALLYYERAAGIYKNQLDNPLNALACFQKILEVKPAHPASLLAIAGLYRDAAQWQELFEVLVLLAEGEGAPTTRREYLVEAASICQTRLDNHAVAVELYERVFGEDPGHFDAFNALKSHYEKSDQWDKAADVLLKYLPIVEDDAKLVESHCRLGEIFENHLDNLQTAAGHYEKALSLNDAHSDSLRGLERFYTRTESSTPLRANLERQLELAETAKQKESLSGRLALLLENEFKEYDTAIYLLNSVLEKDPTHTESLLALGRLCRKNQDWEALVDNLKRRADHADGEEKMALLTERATIIQDKIEDARLTATALEEVTSLGANHALEDLANAHEASGDFEAAVSTLRKLLDEEEGLDGKIALLMRIAKIEIEHLGRPDQGIHTIRGTLEFAPQNRVVTAALRKAYIDQGNYAAAVDTISDELKWIESNSDKAELLAARGVIYLDHIDDMNRALTSFEKAIKLDINNLVAGDRLSELYRNQGEWEKAIPIYERWADAADSLPIEHRVKLFTHLAEAYDRLGKFQDATVWFEKVICMETQDPHVHRQLAESALKIEKFDVAREQFATFLEIKKGDLSKEETASMRVGLGKAALGSGDTQLAATSARQALVASPSDLDAQMLMADVLEKREDFRGFVNLCEQMLTKMDSAQPVFIHLVKRTAHVQFEKLNDARNAIEKLTMASKVDPSDRPILTELLKIYTATEQYPEVAETILRIIELVDDPSQLALYYSTLAKIYHHELNQSKEAVKNYESVLDQDSTVVDASRAIRDILVREQDWMGLNLHYKRALERLTEDAPVEEKISILRPLSEILINRLDRPHEGISITQTLMKLEPSNGTWPEQLAELYGFEEEYIPAAIELNRSLFAQNPNRAAPVKRLFNIYCVTGEADKTWCTTSVLSFLKQASREEFAYYRENLPPDLPDIQSTIGDDEWSRLLDHPSMAKTVTAIFSLISPLILKAKGKSLDAYGLDPTQCVDLETHPSQFVAFVNYASAALGVTPPPLYFRQPMSNTFEMLGADEPILVADATDALADDRKGLAFALGQELTRLRPGFFVHKLAKSGTDLSAWFMAATKSVVPNLQVPENLAATVAERMELMASLGQVEMARLTTLVKSIASSSGELNMKTWARSIEYTMDRAGLLLSGDLETATRMLNAEVDDRQVLTDRLQKLTLFSISDEHVALREFLGIHI